MLKMTAAQGRRDALARQSSLNGFVVDRTMYNTGSTLQASNTVELISYYIAMAPQSLSLLDGPVQPAARSATGAQGCLIYELKRPDAAAAAQPPLVSPSSMVSALRDIFRLTVSDAAQVLRISRPTVYQWESLQDIDMIRAHDDRERLKQVFRLANTWSQGEPLVGRWLHHPLQDGKSVFDLLCEPTIDEIALTLARAEIQYSSSRLRADEHDRSVAAAKAMRGGFAKLSENRKMRMKG